MYNVIIRLIINLFQINIWRALEVMRNNTRILRIYKKNIKIQMVDPISVLLFRDHIYHSYQTRDMYI